jgi:hypothetical protein
MLTLKKMFLMKKTTYIEKIAFNEKLLSLKINFTYKMFHLKKNDT